MLAMFAGLACAQSSPLVCYTSVTVTPALRGESLSEPTGDIILSCTGGTAIAQGGSIPSVNISIFYNTNVTSRLLPVAPQSSDRTSEALLLIDEPGSGLPGYGPSLPLSLCTSPFAGCAAAVGAVPGPTLNTAVVPGTSTPAPNVYQGVVNGNSMTFFGVPVLPPGANAWRIFRMTNVRVNAHLLADVFASPVQASILISGNTTLPISNPDLTVGYVMNALSASVDSAANFSQYSSQTKTSASTLTFSENFSTAFKTRVFAQSSNLYAGQINNPVQNVPGAIYNSESNFVFPIGGTQVAGLADFGTRLKATFNNIPAGVRVFVSTANVNNNGSPIAAPSPVGGSQANSSSTGYAVLVNGESTNDGNAAGGAFPAVVATDTGPGSVPIAEVNVSNGTGSAVWEVVNTNPNTIESFKFAVYVTYSANFAQNSPPLPTSTVNLSFAATSTMGNVADAGSPLPRFDASSSSALPAFTVCNAQSCLSIAQTHTGNFTQGQSNANYAVTVSNLAGANPTSGTVTVTETLPSGLSLVSMSGNGWACTSNTCTRTDALAGGAAYPALAVVVNVAADAPSQLTSQVTVSGGGSLAAISNDPTVVINPVSAVLSIAKTHSSFFLQGQTGAYTVTVSNQAGAGPTSGTVTVTETLPPGLTLVLMYGSGWACAGNTCTRSDALAGGTSYPAVSVLVNVGANAASPQVNAVSVTGGGAADANATDSAVIAGGNQFTCTSNAAVTPALRGEGFTEQVGDIAIMCTSGTVMAPGVAIPTVNLTVSYNTAVTSRLLPTVGNPATNHVSEALLLIDEPGSVLPGSPPQILCTTPLTGCQAYVGAIAGPTLGTAVSSGAIPAPNMYQGVVNGNSVTFFGVPVLPPGANNTRAYRITNVRVNAVPLVGSPDFSPVRASISVSGAAPLPIVNPMPYVGFVSNGLSASVTNGTNLGQCSSQTKTSAATLTFLENFGTAFKTRVLAQSNTMYAGQSGNPVQNVTGEIYNSESGLVLPTANPGQVTGLADFGTRLKATFNNVPPGAHVFVSTSNVNNNAFAVPPPNPIGGSSGNGFSSGNYVGYAMLVNGESVSDGSTPGFFPSVFATDNGPGNGNVPIAEVSVTNGTGTAVWEVMNTNPNTIESFQFAVYVTYTANVAQNSPTPGTTTVNLSLAATANSGVAADAASPMPRFTSDTSPARPAFSIAACTSSSLSIAKTHSGNFAQGQTNAFYTVTVSNQAGASSTTGMVTVTETVPTGMTLVSMAGTGWTCPSGGTTCTRSDVLSAGSSYPPITVTVNVASNAPFQVTNQVGVSGGGSAPVGATDPTVVTLSSPILSIAKTHSGSFMQGQSGATYSVTVSNGMLAGPTSGTVTVTETVPSGLTLVSMAGSGWTCPSGGTTCTRNDALAGGVSYPAITVTVNVSVTAPSTVTNQVSVSGGGSVTAGASDVTTLTPPIYLISTLAGGMPPPTANSATQVDVGRTVGVTVDAGGNIYFSNIYTSVFKLDTGGVLTRVAGTGVAGFSGDNGPAVSAQLNQPRGLTVDGSGNLYIADSMNNRIRKVAPNGIITTVAGNGTRGYAGDSGSATNAALNNPYGVAADGLGNLYIGDTENQRVRRVSANGTITTVAGTGTAAFSGDNGLAANSALHYPQDLALDPAGNLYIADGGNNRVRKVTANGIITTVAGNGTFGPSTDGQPAVSTPIAPTAIAFDSSGNLYINDNSGRIRRVSGANGIVTTIAGSYNWGFGGDGGSALGAAFNTLYGIAVDASGSIYVADSFNHRIRKITASGTITTAAGGGTGDAHAAPFGALSLPKSIARDTGGNLYIADQYDHRVRKIAPNGTISTVAGTGVSGYSGDLGPAANAQLGFPNAVAVDSSGNVYISDSLNARIRKVALNGTITTIAGNGNCGYSGDGGQGASASICAPAGLAVDSAGNLYFSDFSNNRVRKVSTSGVITTVAGTGVFGYSGDNGPATSAALNPGGLAIDAAGNLYIGDLMSSHIRKVATTGTITTIAGNGTNGFSGDGGSATSAAIGSPSGLAVDASGTIYFADSGSSRVRAVTSDGIIRTVAGNGVWDYAGDGGLATSAEIDFPYGVAADPNGNVYVADTYNDAIRVLTPVGARPVLNVTSSHAGNFTAGQNGTYTVTVSNAVSAGGTSGTVTVNELLSGVNSMSGTGWTCGGNTCTRSDTLTGGASYPPITVTVSVPLASPAQITNQATVSGGGGLMAGASDLTVVILPPPSLAIAKTHTGNFTQGQSGATYSVTVTNQAAAVPTSGTVTVTESVPSGLTLVSMAGTGWTCPGTAANNCTRSDVLNPVFSYPPITVTVNVSGNATSPLTNSVSVSGGGSATAGATDPTVVTLSSASLAIAKTHTGNFTQGQTGLYMVTVSNGTLAGPTSGTVTVTETVPAGLTLVSMAGSGWTCPSGGTTCTRNDALAGGASYPTITVTVNVGVTALGSVTNHVSVNCSGSATVTASDVTTVTPPAYLISTVAGRALPATALPGTQASIGRAFAVATDQAGNIYIASYSSVVYKLDANGTLTRVAGTSQAGFSGDNGPAILAQLNHPQGLAVDGAGNLYIADVGNSRIRRVAPNGTIATVAGTGGYGYGGDGGPATSAQLWGPWGVAVDPSGNLYIADYGNRRLRKVAADGTITTIAGTGTEGYSGDNGPAVSAQLSGPSGVAVDSSGNIYISDGNNNRIRKIVAGTITTIAGNGNYGYSGDNAAATGASLNVPLGIALDASGNLYIADSGNDLIRRVSGGIITTVAGTVPGGGFSGDGGPATSAQLALPYGVAVDASGNLYIAEDINRRLRKVAISGTINTVAGGGTGDAGPAPFGTLSLPDDVALDAAGNRYIADEQNHRVRKIGIDGTVSTVAGTGVSGHSGDGGLATSAQLSFPMGLALDGSGNLYIADTANSRVRKVDANGVITTVSTVGYPVAVAVDLSGNLYVSDIGANRVYKIAANGAVTIVAGTGNAGFSGDGGPAVNASLTTPWGLSLDPAGNLYIADSGNYRVRKVSTTGTITTVAGNGMFGLSGDGGPAASAGLTQVFGVAVDAYGNLYLTDEGSSRLRMVNSAGIIRTIAGAAVAGFGGDGGPALGAPLSSPQGLAVDPNGNVYIADSSNDAIRVLIPVGARPVLSVTSSHAGNFTAGQNGTYTVTVSNAASAGATNGTVTVNELLSGTSSMSGTGWTCSGNSCTRSDTLAGGASYPPITVTVSVPLTSPAQITNQATVSGGGGLMAGASDLTVVILPPPSLAIAKTHTGNFVQGQAGLYTLTVSNGTLAGPTSGTVMVTESVPTGLTLVSMAGTGWTCPNGGTTCTRSDVLSAGSSYPPITVTVNVSGNAPSQVTNQVAVSGGGSAGANAGDLTTIGVATCSYSLGPTNAAVASGVGTGTLSVITSAGCSWNAVSNATSWLNVTSGTSGSGNGTVGYSFAANPNPTPRSAAITVGGQPFILTQAGIAIAALRFVPVTPCRIADTRNPAGPFGGPALAGNSSRDFVVPSSSCGIPASAAAYSLNVTVVPLGPLQYISVWPSGQPQPVVSTLNSFDGRIKANAAIVPAGLNGAFSVFATNPTHVVVDIDGYFVPSNGTPNLAFYPVTPCRIADTRNPTGTFGAPSLAAGVPRTFPVPSSSCGIPASAQAYALNMTVVPTAPVGYLTTWPAGSSQPIVSTLNAPTGTVTSNAAIVPAGVNGAITVYATNATDLIIDINGYFAPPGIGSLDFYAATPCRVLDTRNAAGSLGGPIMGAGQSRSFNVPSSTCGIPPTAKAFSLNATVLPSASLQYLTLWGSGSIPIVSTLNSFDGSVVANAALVPAGASGEVTAFTTNLSHLLLDINGYFQ
jgi:uncharacterized repeat protein (TIGR01451 family)